MDLPDYIDLDLWNDWIEYRKKEKKKPAGAIAQKLALNKLSKFHSQGYDVNEILSDAMISGWQGLFVTSSTPKLNGEPHGKKSAAERVRTNAIRAVGFDDGDLRYPMDQSVRGRADTSVAGIPINIDPARTFKGHPGLHIVGGGMASDTSTIPRDGETESATLSARRNKKITKPA